MPGEDAHEHHRQSVRVREMRIIDSIIDIITPLGQRDSYDCDTMAIIGVKI